MRAWATIATAIAIGLGAGRALATPLDGSTLPGDTKWVMHLDVDSARQARIWDAMANRLTNARQRGNAGRGGIAPVAQGQERIQVLAEQLAIKLPEGLHDVTLYGAEYQSAGSVIRIHAEMDEKHAEGLLAKDPTYKREEFDGGIVLSWENKAKGETNVAGFSGKGFVLFSSDEAVVKKGLDALDGKGQLAADSPLNPVAIAAGPGPRAAVQQPAFWLAGVNVTELQRKGRAESPVLAHLSSASLGMVAVGPALGGIHIEARGMADTPETARDIEWMVEGIKGSADLAATAGPMRGRGEQAIGGV